MSPESMVNTGFRLERKYPMCTVCGDGVSVYSATRSAGLPIDAMNSSAHAMTRAVRKLQELRRDRAVNIGVYPTAHDRQRLPYRFRHRHDNPYLAEIREGVSHKRIV